MNTHRNRQERRAFSAILAKENAISAPPTESGIANDRVQEQALAYLRGSNNGQETATDHLGPAMQLESIRKYVADRMVGFTEYCDDYGNAELDLDTRRGFARMLDRLMHDRIHVAPERVHTVYVYAPEHIAYDRPTRALLLDVFRRLKVPVVCVSTGTDLTNGTDLGEGITTAAILDAVWEYDKRVKPALLHAASLRAARQREHSRQGRKPYGDRPGEPAVLALIHSLHKGGLNQPPLSCADIAQSLDEHKIPSRSGRPWNRSTVYKIIHSAKRNRK